MTAFIRRMPAGIPGAITRAWETTTEPVVILGPANASNAPQTYGSAVVIDPSTGKARLPISTDTAISGFLPRPYPGGQAEFDGELGVTPIDYTHAGDILRVGYMSVVLRGETAAAKDGTIYVRKRNSTTDNPIGGVEAAPDYNTTAGVVTGTGNGTWTPDPSNPVANGAPEGVYTLRFLTLTTFQVLDPNGRSLGTTIIGGSTGNSVVFNNQIKGTVTQGATPFAIGDTIAITAAFDTIQLPVNSYFMGASYTDGTYGAMTEIAFNI